MGSRTTHEYWQLVKELTAYRMRFLKEIEENRFDALICPPHALPALTHGSGDLLTVYSAASYAVLFNVLGLLAGVVAATRVRKGEESDRSPGKNAIEQAALNAENGSAGLPIGVQVVSHYWREDVVLAVMAALEKHFREQPEYSVCTNVTF